MSQPLDLPTVTSPAGDHYPVPAGFAVHLMPPYSAPRSGVPVHGVARGLGRTAEFRPGGGHWTGRAGARLRELRAPEKVRQARVTHHVEFQAAAWMIDGGVREGEVVVNRTPCGYRQDLEGRGAGCHQFLPGFLPRGTRLHVYGTDDNGGRAFLHTYEPPGEPGKGTPMTVPDAHEALARMWEHAATPGAPRQIWAFERPDEAVGDARWGNLGPVLRAGIGFGVGVLVWTDTDTSYLATGGTNTEPVSYRWEEFTDSTFPPGTELSSDTVLAAVEQYLARPGRPDVVRWTQGTPNHRIARNDAG